MMARCICGFGTPALAFGLTLAAVGTAPASEWEWMTATPAEAGFAADLGERLDAALASGAYDGVHAVLLVRSGRLVYERYLIGEDEKWGNLETGIVFGPDTLHDLASITKSVTSLLYGIALAEGKVPALDAPLIDSFPEYPDLAESAQRKTIAVRHALTMTMGTEWDEDDISTFVTSDAMDYAPDSIRFTLEHPVVAAAGEKWVYSNGATEVIGEVIARGTGQDVASYARDRLFGPLGIEKFEWIADYYGRPYAAGGLRLGARDMAKIGQLVLQSGRWDGAQVVPAEWIAESTACQAEGAADGCDYGYYWWLCPTISGSDIGAVEASGRGGQGVIVLPELDIVLAVTAGLYADPMAWKRRWGLLEDVVLPALAPQ